MFNKIHIVIQGCGAIAKKHARTLQKLQGDCVFSFSSRDLKRAEEYQKKWGGKKAYGNLEEVLADPSVDCVLLCTPHHTHFPLGMKILESKKHLIIEKPLALSSSEGEKLVALAQSKKVYMNVAENYHYRPALVKLEGWLKEGLLGEVRLVRINKLHQRRAQPDDWRLEKESMGEGAFIDGGIHWVNVLQTIGGRFKKVNACRLSSVPLGNLFETGLSVLANLSQDTVGQLSYSWAFSDYSDLKFFAVYGTEGTVYVSHTFLFMYYQGKRGCKIWIGGIRDPLGFRGMWCDFIEAIKKGTATRMTPNKALDDLRFVEAAYQSC